MERRLSSGEMVQASAKIGFAMAIIRAFTERPGVNRRQVDEALRGLEEALDIVIGEPVEVTINVTE